MNESSDIWKRHGAIQVALMKEKERAMAAYKKDVYWPAMQQLEKDCAAIGHHRGNFWDNGLGCTWFYCSNCGARMDITHNE